MSDFILFSKISILIYKSSKDDFICCGGCSAVRRSVTARKLGEAFRFVIVISKAYALPNLVII